jgi:protein-S-isoprenylcysteine O-methyltransferase Ste14
VRVVVETIAWLACVVYSTIPAFWLVVHPKADYWRSRRRNPFRILLPAWLAMWMTMAAITWPWHHSRFYQTSEAWVPAGILFILGVFIYVRAMRGFSGRQLGGLPEVVAGHRQRLNTSGIRDRVRHPVYLGHLCEMLAWSIGSGLVVNYGLTAFAIVTGAVMIRVEDQELERRFGEEFRVYRERVPSIMPRVRSKW